MPLGPRYRRLFAASTISNLGDGVGVIAYPWLASAITRNPLLIALVAVGQRLPWLLFTLPAGVITDRYDRRRIMIGANSVRAVITLGVALAVLARQGVLPAPDEVDQVVGTEWFLYVLLLVATLLLGTCEVLYDNSAQTFMPSIVETSELEKANGRLYSAEMVANNFAGPPLAGLLLAVGFALPFVVDAASFAASAGLIMAIAATPRRPGQGPTSPVERRPWKVELAEGFRWLWSHDLLRTLAITLGVLNLLGNISGAVVVLYGQEVLGTSVVEFAIYSTAAAVGGVVGGWAAATVIKRIGSGGSLGADAVGRRDLHHRHRPRVELVGRRRAAVPLDVHHRAVERDHGQPAPGDHPRRDARAGQQRLPVLRVGGHPDRRPDRRPARGRAGRSAVRGPPRCGRRGSSPERPSSWSPP